MFCNKCGSKLSATDKVCRTCGLPADQSEACGGFWGLVGMAPPVPVPTPAPQPGPKPVPQPGPKPVPQPAPQPGPKPEPKPALPIWQIACGVLLVLLLIQTFRIGGLRSRVESLENQVDYCFDQHHSQDETEATVPETTVPETTVPETTAPETTAPETTVPETTVPEDTGSIFGTDPGTGISDETTAPEETAAPPETEVPDTNG